VFLFLGSDFLFEVIGINPEGITFAFDAFPTDEFTAGKSNSAEEQQEEHLFHIGTLWLVINKVK
jgi:hypothetical protein